MTTKKSSNSSAVTPATGAKPQDDASATTIAAASNPSGENGPDGTNTGGPSQGDADSGVGNSAGPAGLAEAVAAALVDRAGCASADHMIEMAALGLSFMEALDEASRENGPLKDWAAGNDPVEVFAHLCARIATLEEERAFRDQPSVASGKRGFIALKAVRIDNVLVDVHKPLWLDKDEHAALAGSDVVDREWSNGVAMGG